MSDIIRLLPDSVANQIAAGEVIQRPASVIKELVENSIDAGATDIKIVIKDAGRTLIQVIDNGKGMSETDARMAFERHATSKITSASDLFCLHTMGFRGEALPSICAVSQVELKSKTPNSSIGTHLVINATKVEKQEPAVCDNGTSIMVKNLFFNVPARRKFLKSDGVEMSNILREFERLALVNNKIRMSLQYGTKNIELRSASFKQRIADLWKNSIETQLVPVEVDTSLVKITGFVTRPEYARRRNPLQYLIVNGRNMRHPYFHKAIVGCFESLIAPDTFPCYFLKFEVDPTTIDVNIHPTKNEIKFEYEHEIWPILKASVKAALGHFGAGPSLDFTTDILPVKPITKGEKITPPKINLKENYNPFATSFNSAPYNNKEDKLKQKEWELLYNDFKRASHGFGSENVENGEIKGLKEDLLLSKDNYIGNICIQHESRYLITSGSDGLFIIDQRKAHIKILYEDYLNSLQSGKTVSQNLMFPEIINLDEAETVVIDSIYDQLTDIGFKIERIDESNNWKIISVPAIVKKIDYSDLVLSIIHTVLEEDNRYGEKMDVNTELKENIALLMARKSAIPKTGKLTDDEMEHIVSSLFSLPAPSMLPDGSKIFMKIENKKLDSFFS